MASTKNHQRPPFRAEHMGSLLRPKKLSEKRVALDGKPALDIIQDKELKGLEDEAIDDIVKVQLDLGYHGLTDGEYRRHQFWGTFFPGLEGFEEIMDPPMDMFRLYVPDLAAFSKFPFPFTSPPLELGCPANHELARSQLRPDTSPESRLFALARSSTRAARIPTSGTISRTSSRLTGLRRPS